MRATREGIALLCALVLLFFPISLTDDLHPEIFLTTETSLQRRSSSATAMGGVWNGAHVPCVCLFVFARQSEFTFAADFFGLGFLSFTKLVYRSAAAARSRAPPEFLV